MGMFVNRVELIGNLGRDPEIRHTASGRKVATLNIATSESWKDAQSGEWRERTEWHRVVIFNEALASVAEKHLEKGMKIRVEGKLRTRKWEDRSGQDRYSTEVHVENYAGTMNFDLKRAGEEGPASAPATTGASVGEPDNDVPF